MNWEDIKDFQPRDEQNCLVVNKNWVDEPIRAYWVSEINAFIPLDFHGFPLLVTHWIDLPSWGGDKS